MGTLVAARDEAVLLDIPPPRVDRAGNEAVLRSTQGIVLPFVLSDRRGILDGMCRARRCWFAKVSSAKGREVRAANRGVGLLRSL